MKISSVIIQLEISDLFFGGEKKENNCGIARNKVKFILLRNIYLFGASSESDKS